MKTKYKILIPGGTGFIGYHLCQFFTKKGWDVSSISKSKPMIDRYVKGVNYILCDVSNQRKLQKIIDKRYDYIINLAGYVDHTNNNSILKTHFNGSKNLINLFKDKGLKKFIQIGSSIEYGSLASPQSEDKIKKKINTFSKYGNAKLSSTLYLLDLYRKFKYPITIFRPYLIYGPKQNTDRIIPFVINSCIDKKKFNCSSGIQYRDFLYIDDFANAIYKSLKCKKSNGQVINVGQGKPIKIKNLINLIVDNIGSGKPIFGKVKYRKDEIIRLYPNISKIKKILNWKPKTSIQDGIRRTIQSYLKK